MMTFVGDRGCVRLHGPVRKLAGRGQRHDLPDPFFDLCPRENRIARAWVTKKPTASGVVAAQEIINEDGEVITTFLERLKPGIPETESWREGMVGIPTREMAHVA